MKAILGSNRQLSKLNILTLHRTFTKAFVVHFEQQEDCERTNALCLSKARWLLHVPIRFNSRNFYVLPTGWIQGFSVYLRTESDCFRI